jgi:diadenosine tetraphosphatase ApaH/serine/threonine PP2A family protein phosphatase
LRYAVISDVHGNLEALEAVCADIGKRLIDQVIFLGDAVGYGADPSACLAKIRELKASCVAGNHDQAVTQQHPVEDFNDAAREAVLWTRERMEARDKDWLRTWPLLREQADLCAVHGTLSRPQEFDYMADGGRAAKTFALLREAVCFVGHTHQPGVFFDDPAGVRYARPPAFVLEPASRCIVDAGSVGQPRDGDPRACFCVYDNETRRLEFCRVSYDVMKAQEKIRTAGLPETLAKRLRDGR